MRTLSLFVDIFQKYLVGAVAQFDIANRYSACNSTTSPCDAPEIRYTYPAPPTNKASLPHLYAAMISMKYCSIGNNVHRDGFLHFHCNNFAHFMEI